EWPRKPCRSTRAGPFPDDRYATESWPISIRADNAIVIATPFLDGQDARKGTRSSAEDLANEPEDVRLARVDEMPAADKGRSRVRDRGGHALGDAAERRRRSFTRDEQRRDVDPGQVRDGRLYP